MSVVSRAGDALRDAAGSWLPRFAAEWEPLISALAGLVTIIGLVYALCQWVGRERRDAQRIEAVVNETRLEVANRSSKTIWGVVLRNQLAGTELVNTPVIEVIRPDELETYKLEASVIGHPTIEFQIGGGDMYLWTPRCGILTKCTRGPTRREDLLLRLWPNLTAHISPFWRHYLLGRDGAGDYRPSGDFLRHMRKVKRKQRRDPRVRHLTEA